jgi:hypothetical protein
MSRPLNAQTLHRQNLAFAGTNGVSQNNRRQRFLPAFRDEDTGRVELARFPNGKLAPAHLIVGLPEVWATARAADGSILALKGSITAGFVRDDTFFTREEAAASS